MAALVLMLGGCAKDHSDRQSEGRRVDLGLKMDTYALGADDPNATENETRITEAYVFIYNADGLLENTGNTKVLPGADGKLVDAAGRLNGTWTVYEGAKDIYVILNPHEVGRLTMGTVTPELAPIDLATGNPSKEELAQLITSSAVYESFYNTKELYYGTHYAGPGDLTRGLLMTGVVKGVMVTPAAPEATVSVTRRYARIDLSVRKAVELRNVPVELCADWNIVDVAFQSRLYDASPVWNSAQRGRLFDPDIALTGPVSVESITDYQPVMSFYAMPFPYASAPVSAISSPTLPQAILRIIPSLLIDGRRFGGDEYTIPLTELGSDGKPDLTRPLDIVGNKIYKVNVTLSPHSINVDIRVEDWDDQAIRGDISGSTLSVSQSEVAMDWWNLGGRFNTSVDYTSDGTVSFVGYVVKNADGTDASVTINGSNLPTWLPKNKITGLPDGTSTSGRIGLEYVVTASAEHPDVVLRLKTGNIVKDITVVYDNGFIPSSFLLAQGWPEGMLPGLGIQVAKIGNVLPEDIAANDEKRAMWGSSIVGTGATASGYGSGPINTSKIIDVLGYDPANSVVAKCRALGSTWYLSSTNELKNICLNRYVIFSRSYSMSNLNLTYWSSTENSYAHAWAVSFPSGNADYSAGKTSDFYFRCVRNVDFDLSATELTADWYNWGQSFSTDVTFESTVGAVSVKSIDNVGDRKNWLKSAVVTGQEKGTITITYEPTSAVTHDDVIITLTTEKNVEKKITVKYDNGFVPNSLLAAEGWPADKLPARGLQVAKLGTTLPEGVAASEETRYLWSASFSNTINTELTYGSGEANTDKIIAVLGSDPANSAAAKCRSLGPEWYLLSRDELLNLYKHKNLMTAPSYIFPTDLYWSSSEYSATSSWYVSFDTGITKNSDLKPSVIAIRCVRKM